MSAYKDIIEKLRLRMPLVVTLPDPVSGQPFSVNRDNILQLLVIDTANLHFEAATLAALYGEMARIHAAAIKHHEDEEVLLRTWKAQMREEHRRACEKKPTDRACDDYYQQHPEYKDRYQKTIDAKVLIGLSDDLKKAFELKSFAIGHLSGDLIGHNRAQNSTERLQDMALTSLAEEAMAASGSANAAADFREGKSQADSSVKTEVAPTPPAPKKPPKRSPAKTGATETKRTARKARTTGKGTKK